MRNDSPAVMACPKHRYGMHSWHLFKRVDSKGEVEGAAARCTQCGLEVYGQDALDLLHGAEL